MVYRSSTVVVVNVAPLPPPWDYLALTQPARCQLQRVVAALPATSNDGGNGGAGSSGLDLDSASPGLSASTSGGAAGGGAAGYIYAPGIIGNTAISPPSQNPHSAAAIDTLPVVPHGRSALQLRCIHTPVADIDHWMYELRSNLWPGQMSPHSTEVGDRHAISTSLALRPNNDHVHTWEHVPLPIRSGYSHHHESVLGFARDGNRLWVPPLNQLPDDANTNVPPDTQLCFGSYVRVCFDSASNVPTAPRTWTVNVDTDTDVIDATSFCDQHNDQKAKYCVVTGKGMTLAAGTTLRARGTKPLVLLATTAFDLQGLIDVSSKQNDSHAGAGARASCTGGTAAMGHSGGYGGTFGGRGGNGGTPVVLAGETGGAPATPLPPTVLIGGCPGGDGAMTVGDGGPGGNGGGAVAIIASAIHFNGQINASGAGGSGGPASVDGSGGGGGGGGSGGMIVLDATTIDVGTAANLWVFANGGGGGQGGTGTGAGQGPGAPGKESRDPASAADAGNDTSLSGGPGGIGSYSTSKADGAQAGTAANSGGGGAGGGGAGFIRSPPIAGAMFAPIPISP
jgi:hypothetical protein